MANASTDNLINGHAALLCCAVLYLVWWLIFFRPHTTVSKPLYGIGVLCILGATLTGIFGTLSVAQGAYALDESTDALLFIGGAVVAYLVLVALTRGILKRQITTELVLIVAWSALEFFTAHQLFNTETIPNIAGWFLFALTLIFTAESLVCYTLYFRVKPLPALFIGAAPLASVGIESLIVIATLI